MSFKALLLFILMFPALQAQQKHSKIPQLGEQAPEIVLAKADGSIVKLSDLRGKLVLVDFWASWCGRCHQENAYLQEAYERYKNQSFYYGDGFEIYSVSLDTDSTAWQQSIHNAGLSWPSQVCDYKAWESPVLKAYGFRGLPNNFLVDANGRIVAKRLFGQAIAPMLERFVKKP